MATVGVKGLILFTFEEFETLSHDLVFRLPALQPFIVHCFNVLFVDFL